MGSQQTVGVARPQGEFRQVLSSLIDSIQDFGYGRFHFVLNMDPERVAARLSWSTVRFGSPDSATTRKS